MSLQEEDPDDASGLRTPRLTLRPPEPADAGQIARLANNARVAAQTARLPHPYRESDALEWISMLRRGGDEASGQSFVVADRGPDGAIVGAVGYGRLDGEEFEIGYWVGEPYWGRGIATEAVQTVIDHAFGDVALPRLLGRCRVGNRASRRVLEKCGFQFLGPGMIHSRALNGPVATEDFVLERSIWQSLKRWGLR